jgi:NTE family protein
MKFVLAVLSTLALITLTQANQSKTCKVLALRGGGTKGAYQVGAL